MRVKILNGLMIRRSATVQAYGQDIERVDDTSFGDLVQAYGTEFPIDVDPTTVTLPEEVEPHGAPPEA